MENKEKFYIVSIIYDDGIEYFKQNEFVTNDIEYAIKWTNKVNRIVENNKERIKSKINEINRKLENGEEVVFPYKFQKFAHMDDMKAYVYLIEYRNIN